MRQLRLLHQQCVYPAALQQAYGVYRASWKQGDSKTIKISNEMINIKKKETLHINISYYECLLHNNKVSIDVMIIR